MAKEVDPYEMIMRSVANVDFDSYGNSKQEKQEAPVTDEINRDGPPSSVKKKTQKKEGKPKDNASTASEAARVSTITMRYASRERLRVAKLMYECATGRRLSLGEFVDELINSGLPVLSREAAKQCEEFFKRRE